MNELIFLVEEAPEGGFTARALGQSIFTEAETLAHLRQQVRDGVQCHFDEGKVPTVRIGTLSGILGDVASQLEISREELARRLFGA